MSFITPDELNTHLYGYKLKQITEDNTSIAEIAIATAVEECKSYLNPNNKSEYEDGRFLYDTDLIFSATGDERSPLIMSLTKDIAVYQIVVIANVDIIYKQAQDRYDRTTAYLHKIAKGDVSPDLPKKTLDPTNDNFVIISREKFNYD